MKQAKAAATAVAAVAEVATAAVVTVREAAAHGARLAAGKFVAAVNGSRIVGEVTRIVGDTLHILAFEPEVKVVTLAKSDVIVRQTSQAEVVDFFVSMPLAKIGAEMHAAIAAIAANEEFSTKEQCDHIGATLFGASWARADYRIGDMPFMQKGENWILAEVKAAQIQKAARTRKGAARLVAKVTKAKAK